MLGLGLDRCLCLLYPIKYTSFKARFLVFTIILSMALILAFSLIFRILPAYPTTAETKCLSFGCTTTTNGGEIYTYIRYLTSSAVLITSGFLLYLVRFKLKLHLSQKLKTQNLRKFLTTF
uniref:G-protein coupled receptors family 1 profile domain-containing protein n=1 Tax=Panagrolaimus davidi TaxID=227884 RepID=A0A914QJ47_9BILA